MWTNKELVPRETGFSLSYVQFSICKRKYTLLQHSFDALLSITWLPYDREDKRRDSISS